MNSAFALLAATISVVGAVISVYFGNRLARQTRLDEADQLAVRFREPLIQSAFNLQSRLYNIVRQAFLERFLRSANATVAEREYAVCNTVFLVGQYLGWVEAIRWESQYVDPRSREHNRQIVEALESVRDAFASSTDLPDPVFRLFRGEQRAIGEVMLLPSESTSNGVPRWECRGYASFIAAHEQPDFVRWLKPLEDDTAVMGYEPEKHVDRLVALQHSLLDLVDVLDPGGERVPLDDRQRL